MIALLCQSLNYPILSRQKKYCVSCVSEGYATISLGLLFYSLPYEIILYYLCKDIATEMTCSFVTAQRRNTYMKLYHLFMAFFMEFPNNNISLGIFISMIKLTQCIRNPVCHSLCLFYFIFA